MGPGDHLGGLARVSALRTASGRTAQDETGLPADRRGRLDLGAQHDVHDAGLGLEAADDRTLELSYRLKIDIVPTLLRRDRGTEAERAIADARAGIARELHDVVAHNVSVMTVQAGVPLHTVQERAADADLIAVWMNPRLRRQQGD